MTQKKLSIIIPIYNAEKYIIKCIDSILSQEFKLDYELFLINNNSTDESESICSEYEYENPGIVKFLSTKTKGPSAARNLGLKNANGEYIVFMDADDYLTPNAFKHINDSLLNKNTDLFIFGYNNVFKNNTQEKKILEKEYNKNDFFQHFCKLYQDGFLAYVWNKVYKTEIIKKYNIEFNESINRGEDVFFNLQVFAKCNNISSNKNILYNYVRYNDNSITNKFKEDLFVNHKNIMYQLSEFVSENHIPGGKSFIGENFRYRFLESIYNLTKINSKRKYIETKRHIRDLLNNDFTQLNKNYFRETSKVSHKIIYLILKYKLSILLSFIILTFGISPKLKKIGRFLK